MLIMVGAWVSLCVLRASDQGAWWLFWLFVLTTATDVGAYFVGKAYGKNHLAKQLSPGKTWEGAIGGGAIAHITLRLYFDPVAILCSGCSIATNTSPSMHIRFW